MRECEQPECVRQVRARDLCLRHYNAARTAGLFPDLARPCAAPGCDRTARAGGLCDRDYQRQDRLGTTELAPRPTLAQRIDGKITRLGLDQCWPTWDGAHDRRGYPTQHVETPNGRMPIAVARLLLGLSPGDGLVARHTCDNPPCVNRAHLLVGTRQDNVRDAVERDRLDRGEDHVNSKLTDAAVRDIRSGSETVAALAIRYGVTRHTVRSARERVTWRHVR